MPSKSDHASMSTAKTHSSQSVAAGLPLMTDQVYEAVRRDILCCALPPGAAISEASLAARYGYGKSPVRLALSRLRQEGLVHASPRRSFVVSSITLRDVHDLYELRLVLEPAVARLAAGKVDVRALKKVDTICRKGYVARRRDEHHALSRRQPGLSPWHCARPAATCASCDCWLRCSTRPPE